MAAERPPPSPSSLAGMGNTTTNTTLPITITTTATQNPTNTAHNVPDDVHNVQLTATVSFVSSSDGWDEKKHDVLSVGEHKSGEPVTVVNGAAHRARTVRSPQQPPSNTDSAGKHDALMPDGVAVAQRIPTPPHPIARSHYATPNLPDTAAAAPAAAIAAVLAVLSSSPSSSASSPSQVLGTELSLDVDLRSPGCHYAMSPSPANNYAMLQKIIHKMATVSNVSYSPAHMMPGMNKRVEVQAYTTARMADLRAKKQTAAAAASPPNKSDVVTVPSHRFHLSFDNPSNTRTAVIFLDSIGLCPMIPPATIVRGKVYGIPYHTSDADITAHLQNHVWYEGGAPSLVITRVSHRAMRGIVDDMCRDECYFTVLRSEFKHARQIPTIRASPPRPLRWFIYHPSASTVCTHCFKQGHTRKSCKHASTTNKQGIRDACSACGSFDHTIASCTAMKDPAYVCMLCHAGKHSMTTCPVLRGSYTEIAAGPHDNANTRVSAHTQAQTRPSDWSRKPNIRQQRSQQQPQQQHQQQQQQQQPHTSVPSRPAPHRHDTELSDIVKMLREEVSALRTQLSEQSASIKLLAETNAQQMQVILALTARITHSTASGGVMIAAEADMHARVVHSPVITTSSMPAPKPRSSSVSSSSSGNSRQPMLSFTRPATPTKAVATPSAAADTATADTATTDLAAVTTPSASAPTTPIATSNRFSPIVPLHDGYETDTSMPDTSTPRRSKANAGKSGRKRGQSTSPAASPMDTPTVTATPTSPPTSARSLVKQLDTRKHARTNSANKDIISQLTSVASGAKTAPAKQTKRR
jgi:hypothetical protein